jgi:coenzyme F420-0:L-glutamate ligase/coenzyme F420-1:gamma-L-glutamate ligase
MAVPDGHGMSGAGLRIEPVRHVPEIRPGMNLAQCLRTALAASGLELEKGDILAVTQKVISKAEGRLVKLDEVEPSAAGIGIARQTGKDARFVEVVLRETRRIVRVRGEVLICQTHHGFICANAGVDRSNIEGDDIVALLPRDPDRSARGLAEVLGCGIIVTDTFGRPWREGLLDTAIGLARVPPFIDFRGSNDSYGHLLRATVLAAADALAAAAGLVMGKTGRTPAALIRGFLWEDVRSDAASMLRAAEKDLFL